MPLGHGQGNNDLQTKPNWSASNLLLPCTSKIFSNSHKSIASLPTSPIMTNDTKMSTSPQQWVQSYLKSNLNFKSGISTDTKADYDDYLGVPNAIDNGHFAHQDHYNKSVFTERSYCFQRSKSWAKYHGSHAKNKPTRLHRRSRSDLGGLLRGPLNETDNKSTPYYGLGRSAPTCPCLQSLVVSVVVSQNQNKSYRSTTISYIFSISYKIDKLP